MSEQSKCHFIRTRRVSTLPLNNNELKSCHRITATERAFSFAQISDWMVVRPLLACQYIGERLKRSQWNYFGMLCWSPGKATITVSHGLGLPKKSSAMANLWGWSNFLRGLCPRDLFGDKHHGADGRFVVGCITNQTSRRLLLSLNVSLAIVF